MKAIVKIINFDVADIITTSTTPIIPPKEPVIWGDGNVTPPTNED